MQFLMIVKARLNVPFADWVAHFDAEDAQRRAGGVECIFRHPIIGEQSVVFGMRTENPRSVHDMMYHPMVRPGIEGSGLVIGSEEITVCEAI